MTKPHGKEIEEADDIVLAADEPEEVPEVVAPAAAPGPGRKALGVKEPIIFKWKIVGHSQGLAVTLFKSVEREDADAQLERLTRDGYYTNLEIMDANAKVIQPEPPKVAKRSAKPRDSAGKPAIAASEPKKVTASKEAKPMAGGRRSSGAKVAEKSTGKSTKSKALKPAARKPARKK